MWMMEFFSPSSHTHPPVSPLLSLSPFPSRVLSASVTASWASNFHFGWGEEKGGYFTLSVSLVTQPLPCHRVSLEVLDFGSVSNYKNYLMFWLTCWVNVHSVTLYVLSGLITGILCSLDATPCHLTRDLPLTLKPIILIIFLTTHITWEAFLPFGAIIWAWLNKVAFFLKAQAMVIYQVRRKAMPSDQHTEMSPG